jgi:hypothetical protein
MASAQSLRWQFPHPSRLDVAGRSPILIMINDEPTPKQISCCTSDTPRASRHLQTS